MEIFGTHPVGVRYRNVTVDRIRFALVRCSEVCDMDAQVSTSRVHELSLGNSVFHHLFLLHPRTLGESYWEHQRHALAFGTMMVVAGMACVVHALVPGLFMKTGSNTIRHLYDRLILTRRIGHRGPPQSWNASTRRVPGDKMRAARRRFR